MSLRKDKPGLAPAGHLLFCFAKKEGKKGDRKVAALRGWSREFGQHAVRLRNGTRLQARTPSPEKEGAKAGSEINSPAAQ
ncbi:hypothetical protein, partial [Noviherbaspirillum sp.]|uniref:hypothetical protein n=1 Tax=Noviherbaspirillum sp. TaxID=1926288 RepID=UPI002FE1206D